MSAAPQPVETAPCYCCASRRGVPEGRWWVLPAVSHHVRCVDCGLTYNGNTGESNTPVFLLYLGLALLGATLGYLFYFNWWR